MDPKVIGKVMRMIFVLPSCMLQIACLWSEGYSKERTEWMPAMLEFACRFSGCPGT